MAKIYPFGSLEITVEPGSQLFARSESEWQLYQIVGAPNFSEKNKLISEVAENTFYSSGILSERTKYRLDAHESALYWGNTQDEVDPESDIYNQGGTGAVDRTVVSKLQEIVSVKDFGAVGDGVTDDTDALMNFFSAISGSNKPIGDLGDSDTYLFSELTIASNIKLRGSSTLHCDGTTAVGDANVVCAGGIEAECLNFTTEGTETNFDFMIFSGDDYRIGRLTLECSSERVGTGGVSIYGSNISIDYFMSKNIARGLALGPEDPSTDPQATNIHIGEVYVDTYIRGFKVAGASNWSVSSINAKGNHSGASVTPGHNGVLIYQVTDWSIGDIHVEDSGEHGFRIGGTDNPSIITENGTINSYYSKSTGASGFKINPSENALVHGARNISIGQIVVIDAGQAGTDDTGNPAGNQDGLRISDARDIYIGSFVNMAVDNTYSSNHSVNMNSVLNVCIDSIYSTDTFGNMLKIDKDIDEVARDFSGLFINSFDGVSSSSPIISIEYDDGSREIGDIYVKNMNIDGSYSYIVSFAEAIIQSGTIHVQGLFRGTSPNLSFDSSGATLSCDFSYENKRFIGEATGGIAAAALHYLSRVPEFDNSASVTEKASYYIDTSGGTAGVDNYGGAYGFSRLGSSRRAAAIAMKQTGSNSYNTGLGFFVSGGVSIAGTDSVTEWMLLRHDGTLWLGNLSTYADNASAITGGKSVGDIYQTATGELRIVV